MIHGETIPLSETKERAKLLVMQTLVQHAEQSDNVPPTMRAMYVLKTTEAQNVLLGERSSFIEQEATLRGVQPSALAQLIVQTSQQMVQLELKRVGASLLIDAATDESGVVSALETLGLVLPDQE